MAGSIVQSPAPTIDDSGANSTTVAQTLTGVTAGNTILAFVGWSDGAGTITASVSDGTAYATAAAKQRQTTDVQSSHVFILENAGAGSHTVTATFSTTTSFRRIRLVEVSGVQTSSSVDQATGAAPGTPGTGANAVTTGATPSTTNANDFVLGFAQNTTESTPGTGTITAGTGYTLVDSNLIMSVESKSVSATGAQTATWTRGTTNNSWTLHVVALKESGAAAPTVTNVSPAAFAGGQVGVTITGTTFEASQGAGNVIISPSDNAADGSAVSQTETAWADTSITITTARGSLNYGAQMYLFVTNNAGASNANGYPVRFQIQPALAWFRA